MTQNSVGRLSRSSSLTKNQSLVDTPAYQAAADMLVDDADFQEIEFVGHYRIISLLGEGGRVYLAEDTKLHRRVTLKFLSRKFTQNEERLRRFEKEARARIFHAATFQH